MLKGISRYFSFKDRGPTRFLLPLLWWLDFIVSWSLKLYPSNSSWGLSSSIFFFRFPSLLPSVIYSPQIASLFLRGISQVLKSPRILRLCFMFFRQCEFYCTADFLYRTDVTAFWTNTDRIDSSGKLQSINARVSHYLYLRYHVRNKERNCVS